MAKGDRSKRGLGSSAPRGEPRPKSVLVLWLALFLLGSCSVTPFPLPERDWPSIIRDLVEQAIETGETPGCVVAVGTGEELKFLQALGHRQIEPSALPMTTDTRFDLASLTKPVVTAACLAALVEEGRLSWRDPVVRYLPEFGQAGKETLTLGDLLLHVGGLIADNSLEDYQHGVDEAWRRMDALELQAEPRTAFVYSDVGYLALGRVIERVSGRNLAEYARERLFVPLGMEATRFIPERASGTPIATTEKRDGAWLCGEVHDPRAHFLGGVAGHAGLFSCAEDLSRFARMLLNEGELDGVRVLSSAAVREMTRPRPVPGGWRSYGWDVQSRFSRNRGELFSSRAYGHSGFTGTSLWIDPEQDLFVLVLATRLHPDGQGSILELARRVGSVAAANLGKAAAHSRDPGIGIGALSVGRCCVPHGLRRVGAPNFSPPAVRTGIDVLESRAFAPLANQRVGLITNHTGVSADGRRTIDVLHSARQVDLCRLFSPEHGIRGVGEGEIDHTVDSISGLPVVSLYGESRRPNAEQLTDLDTLVFDIQDAGVRFYTYISTMGLAMEAAAKCGLRFVVLDRPNPLGGLAISGPMRDDTHQSFTAFHDLPVRHGMTVGELAQMFRHERGLDLDLEIVAMEHWDRDRGFDTTGLPWINPSPNLRNLRQALLYPGVALLEFTNVSVGRGTDAPFEWIGAPWLDHRTLARRLQRSGLRGISFVPAEFEPSESKYAGERCRAVQLLVLNAEELCPLALGFTLATTLRDLHPKEWEREPFARLLANDPIFDAFSSGAGPERLLALSEAELAGYLSRRAPHLLYGVE